MSKIDRQVLLDRIIFEQEGSLLPMLNSSCMQSLKDQHKNKMTELGKMSPRKRRLAIATGTVNGTPMGAKAF